MTGGGLRIDFAPSKARRLLIGLAILGCVEIVAIASVVRPGLMSGAEHPGWFAWFLAVVVGLLLVLLIAGAPAMLRHNGLTLTSDGLLWHNGGQLVTIGWDELSGVRVRRAPLVGGPPTLELYPAHPHFTMRHPELSLYRATDPTAAAGPAHYRFTLPRHDGVVRKASDALQEFCPQLFLR